MSVQALEPASQRSGGNTAPGSVQKTCVCGTWGYGLMVNLAVLGS